MIVRLITKALEGGAEILDRARERIDRSNGMTTRQPDSLTPGSWGGDADPQAKVQRARDEANIQQQHAALEQAARDIAAGKAPPPPPPGPQYQRQNIPAPRVPDIYEAMAEEGIREDLINKKTVVIDDPNAVKIPGVAEGLRAGAVVQPTAGQPAPVAPGLQAPPTAAQSALAAKRKATEGGIPLPVPTINQIRRMVESGAIGVPGLVDLLGACAELQYAIAEAMKG